MPDDSESLRRELLPLAPDFLQMVIDAGGRVWTTEELREEFDVLGFAAPLCIARRKSDGRKGALMFTHMPRYYFDWQDGGDEFQ
jgi:hypothetical protein